MLLRSFMRHCMLICIALTVAAGFASAQDLKSKIPVDPEVTTGKLDNGLTYYIRPNKKPEKKVELRLVVKAGSILETNEQLGLAHFMEHMNFNGTKNFQKNDLVSYLQSIGVQFGADLNAYTSFDETVYILPIPTDKAGNLEKGFQIIEDWAHNALLTDKDIDEERGVVLEESRLGKGANDRMLKKYFPKLAEGTLYADRLPIGKDEILRNFKYETIRSFYRDWYRPDLQAVMVVGDIDVATAKKMITEHFGSLKNPAKERPRNYETVNPRKAADAMVVTDKEATNSLIILTFPSTKKRDVVTLGDYRQMLVDEIASTIINERLSDLVKSANPPFPYAQVGVDDMIHGYQALQAYVLFGDNDVEKALNGITAEVIRAKKFGVTETELELARKDMLSSIEKAYNERKTTNSNAYIGELVRVFLEGEPAPGLANEFEYQKSMLPGITVAEVNATIQRWTASNNTFTLITAPEKADVKLPTDKELLAMTQKGFAQEITKTEEKKVNTELMPVKPTPGKVVSQVKEQGLDATTYTLSNGVKVTIKQTNFKSDEILMTATKNGGSNSYGEADRSNVLFCTDAVESMGVGAFTPTDLEKALAGKKIEVSPSVGEISDNIKGNCTIKDFESMMQVLNLYLTSPRKDEPLFNSYKTQQTAMVQNMTSSPRFAFIDTMVYLLYNGNPLRRMAIPKPSDLAKINMERALEIYKNEFCTADGYHFFLVGNIDPAEAVPLIEMYIGSLPKSGKPATFKDNGVRPVTGVKEYRIRKGKEKQSLIMNVYTGEIAYSEDLAMKASALGEVLNIKVIEQLREKMGAIYGGGFGANVAKEPYARYSIQLQLPCGPENVDKLIAAAKTEISNLKQNGPEAKDVEKVKSQWLEKYRTDVKENKYWTGKLESVLFWGRNADRVLNYESYVNKLTPADIQATAKQLFDGKNEFTAILLPEE